LTPCKMRLFCLLHHCVKLGEKNGFVFRFVFYFSKKKFIFF
jgi:hypothetical protein